MIFPSLSLHMKGIFSLLQCCTSVFIFCDISVLLNFYSFILLVEENFLFLSIFIKKFFKTKTETFFRIFNDACVQVQLEISCLRLFLSIHSLMQHDIFQVVAA